MKNLRKLFNFMICYGIFMLIGTAGASDLETIAFSQVLFRILVSIGLIAFGHIGKRALVHVRLANINKMRKQQYKTDIQLPIVS